jgi:hypothetical protein
LDDRAVDKLGTSLRQAERREGIADGMSQFNGTRLNSAALQRFRQEPATDFAGAGYPLRCMD